MEQQSNRTRRRTARRKSAAAAKAGSGCKRAGAVTLHFSNPDFFPHVSDPFHLDISAVARAGDDLFLACDETASVERLSRIDDATFDDQRHFPLSDFFDLPAGPEAEIDIEGLAIADDCLWIAGSHALKRKKPKREEHASPEALSRMLEIVREPNRYFLGCVPLEKDGDGRMSLVAKKGGRKARAVKLSKKRSDLIKWLDDDAHLAPFFDIPSKENGFDIEGLAVHGGRIWLGLRGPVLLGYAVILELELEPKGKTFKARKIEDGRRYRKHLIDTRGLGVRDLRFDGDDLLVLAGPTMTSDGPARVYRWKDAPANTVSGVVATPDVTVVTELPHEHKTDHPEGLELWPEAGPTGMLVLYDSPAKTRVGPRDFSLTADIFTLSEA